MRNHILSRCANMLIGLWKTKINEKNVSSSAFALFPFCQKLFLFGRQGTVCRPSALASCTVCAPVLALIVFAEWQCCIRLGSLRTRAKLPCAHFLLLLPSHSFPSLSLLLLLARMRHPSLPHIDGCFLVHIRQGCQNWSR